MSQLEKALQDIIVKATESYKEVATNDPVVVSSDDNTARGKHLDRILKDMQQEKKELWDKLYKLENQRINNQANSVFDSTSTAVTSADRKQLQALMFEHREINSLVATEMEKIDTMEQPQDEVLEVEFRQDLDKQIKEYTILNAFIKKQQADIDNRLNEEKRVLSECEDLYKALRNKERELAQEAYIQTYPDQLRSEQLLWEKQYKKDIHDLIDFLEEYYPPHPVDNAGEMGEECELKDILEQLMNQRIDSPGDPYIKLEPGTYWTPYIQTLVKGGIAQYHPTDSSLIQLHDFRY